MPTHQIDHAPMRHHHPFGLSAGAGGIDNVGQMVLRQPQLRRAAIYRRTLRPGPAVAIQFDRPQPGRQRAQLPPQRP
ncbi:hypothetical protein, partial [Pectobacterium odoriferum]|uniref:hypothetical protein n=1 Tax=Pectobacterium odoriferum TaxID=78398 RepID=UPI003D9A5752